MMKVIIDTNIWISFLLGYQVQLVRQIQTDKNHFSIQLQDFDAINDFRDRCSYTPSLFSCD